jgi:ferrous iron transport protein B
MMGLYLTGILIALVVSYLLHKLVRAKERSLFMLELPLYRSPRWKNVFTTMIEKAKIFAVDAGKIIIIISLLLWFLSSYGPAEKMDAVKSAYQSDVSKASDSLAKEEAAQKFAVKRLENSYAGIMGHFMEPVIQPLGFDWKIGLSLITSFAAREVFVGTMATLYSVNEEDQTTLKTKMERAVRSDGSKVYTLGTGVSLMLFYLLAMQCMSTLAVVKRETNTWKWPILQLLGMTVLAYLASWLAFTLLG